MKDLNNKIVWITGASSGIGKELAIQLAQEGARIILTARSEDKLRALKTELKGDEHWIVPMDLMQVDQVLVRLACLCVRHIVPLNMRSLDSWMQSEPKMHSLELRCST